MMFQYTFKKKKLGLYIKGKAQGLGHYQNKGLHEATVESCLILVMGKRFFFTLGKPCILFFCFFFPVIPANGYLINHCG
jgi:hypothetical protein